jgi:hypothetical protein
MAKKSYNDLSSTEHYILNEYWSWKKSDCNISLKLDMLQKFHKRASIHQIEHLI